MAVRPLSANYVRELFLFLRVLLVAIFVMFSW